MTLRRDPRLYVDDILEAIANIEADTEGLEFETFAGDRRVRQLVERNIEIISEASRGVPDDLKAMEPDVPWREIAGWKRTAPRLRPDSPRNSVGHPDAPPSRPEAGSRTNSPTSWRVELVLTALVDPPSP
jgi:hypothetical protein